MFILFILSFNLVIFVVFKKSWKRKGKNGEPIFPFGLIHIDQYKCMNALNFLLDNHLKFLTIKKVRMMKFVINFYCLAEVKSKKKKIEILHFQQFCLSTKY